MRSAVKPVTVKDIAARLHVSLSTVNKALTGKSGVSEKRRAEVVETARRMGYSVNHAAQSLSRRPLTIGAVLPAVWRQFFADVEVGMRAEFERLARSNVRGLFELTQTEADTESACDRLIEEGVDALIYCPSIFPLAPAACERLRQSGVPVFLAGSGHDGIDAVCTVSVNGYLAGAMAADLTNIALPRGAEIAVFTGSKDIKVHVEKVRAFASRVTERGYRVVGVYETQDDPDIAEAFVKKLYRECPGVRGLYVATAIAPPIVRYVESLPEGERPLIVATDVYDELRDAIKRGVVAATVFQNQVLMGRLSVKLAYDFLIESSSYRSDHWQMSKRARINPHLLFASNIEFFGSEDGNDYVYE